MVAGAESCIEWTCGDGLRLHVRRWQPPGRARALVVVAHGFVEHGGRYAELAQRLNLSHMAVWIPDCRGHGRSQGSRIWVDRFDRYVDDFLGVVGEARREHPGLPVFFVGHSMGGLVATLASLTEGACANGLILSAPAVGLAKGLFPWLRRLAGWASRLLPRLRLARMGSAMLTRDPRVLAEFRNDPLVYHGRIPSRTGAEILRACGEARRAAARVRLPVLILQGTADAVVSAAEVQRFYDELSSGDKTLRLYPGLYHDLPREPERQTLLAELAAWIEQRCGG
jgi:alpha-beta hydrolase superfamily lysophospholipase